MAVTPVRRSVSLRAKVALTIFSLLASLTATVVVSSDGHANTVAGHRAQSAGTGYWLVSPDGHVTAHGGAKAYGSLPRLASGEHAVSIAGAADGLGYWVVTNEGRVFAFGQAKAYGGLAARNLAAHPSAAVVAIAPAPDGKGYWLVDTRGQVYSFGHAHFFGPKHLLSPRSPVASVVADPTGGGYWVVTRSGRVLGYGDAHVYGSATPRRKADVIGMAATPDGKGYWLATSQGRVRAFGEAHGYGSVPTRAPADFVGIAASPGGTGYWLVGRDGATWAFGGVRPGQLKAAPLQVAGIAVSSPLPYSGRPASGETSNDRGSPGTTTATNPRTASSTSTSPEATSVTSAGATTATALPGTVTPSPTSPPTSTSSAGSYPSTTATSVTSPVQPAGTQPVAGEDYELCTDPVAAAEYLTSPWTYHALTSGSEDYTVAQYQSLPGYGVTLPPLPSYIADEPPSTEAAVIYAPGSQASAPSYGVPESPVLMFFEGGTYGSIGFESAAGDLFVGGSASGFSEPVFADGGTISDQEDSYDFSGGGSTLTATATAGATTVTTADAISGYIGLLTFADGTTYPIASQSGTTITLTSPLSASENAGTAVWASRSEAIGNLAAPAAQGSTTIATGAVAVPVVPWEYLDIGAADGSVETAQVSQVSGSEAGGYTLTLTEPLSTAASAAAPVYYGGPAGGVTVEYLDIGNGGGGTTFWVSGGSGWTIEHNDIHDNYAGGADYATTSAAGTAINGADHSTIEYNCFQRLGEYALNGGGTGTAFDYNQVDETPYQPDLSGNGQSGCGKWWGSTNNDLVGNAFTDEGRSACVWFDNGNTGMLVQGNYFYNIGSRAIQNETGYNSEYLGNLFVDVEAGIYLNDSGGWDIPGSNYEDEIVVQGNTFYNAQEAIDIWGASGRSCLNSGEATANGESDPYCSGGSPQMPPDGQYFTHYHDSTVGAVATVAGNEDCSSSSPCSSVTLSGAPAIDDFVGFASQAPDACSSSSPCGAYADDPVETSTTDGTDVSSFTGAGTINVASTAGFPASGQLLVDTSVGSLPYSTGAVVSYTGTTATSFTGVGLVSGSGTLTGTVEAVQPYHVTAVTCPGGNCSGDVTVDVSPPVTTALAAGTAVYSTGTCPYYDTVAATPSSPMAPDGTSYYDGCMWEDRNISVTGNTFDVDPAQFDSAPAPEGGAAWTCTTGPSGDCAQDTMGYQYPGDDAGPYNNVALSNAMMSDSSLPAPYDNLNASGSPLATGANGDVGPNGALPYDDLWSANTYVGDWTFDAYTQAAACPLNWTGSSLAWTGTGGGGNACSGLSLSQWQQYWGQDAGSS